MHIFISQYQSQKYFCKWGHQAEGIISTTCVNVWLLTQLGCELHWCPGGLLATLGGSWDGAALQRHCTRAGVGRLWSKHASTKPQHLPWPLECWETQQARCRSCEAISADPLCCIQRVGQTITSSTWLQTLPSHTTGLQRHAACEPHSALQRGQVLKSSCGCP